MKATITLREPEIIAALKLYVMDQGVKLADGANVVRLEHYAGNGDQREYEAPSVSATIEVEISGKVGGPR